jgi:hypothetical protein
MARIYAGILGLLAFATVVARGLVHAGSASETIRQASMVMFVFTAVGYAVGRVAQWTVDDSVRGRLAGEIANQSRAASTRTTAAKPAAA